MSYYAIKTNGRNNQDPYIWWIAQSETAAWISFFQDNPHRLPIAEAIEAYEAIGYKCVKVKVEEEK